MNDMNQVLIDGRLVKDPEGKKIGESGRSVCNFTIGSNRYFKNANKETQQETVFLDIEAWGTLAENCQKYLGKGRGVRVVGRLKQDNWIGKEDQKNHSKLYVMAQHVEFMNDGKARAAEEGSLDGEKEEEA